MRERLDISQFRVVLFKMVEQWSVEYTSNLNSVNNDAPKTELSLWTNGYGFARSNVKIKSKRDGNEITYSIPVGDMSEAGSIKEIAVNGQRLKNSFKASIWYTLNSTIQYHLNDDKIAAPVMNLYFMKIMCIGL